MAIDWFKPKTILDKAYEIGLFVKAIDGTIELISGILVLVLSPSFILSTTHSLVDSTLRANLHSFIGLHILHSGQKLAEGHKLFAALFLLTHGLVKIVLVVYLLMNKIWVYPYALGVLTLFLVFQVYSLIVTPGFGMAVLAVLDIVIIWLVWREWEHVKRERANLVPRH